ncbi:YecA family protein [Oceanobacillus senegalensis]|uniref:YecA family protein n=1 Tax=Oceanobacillus senegalensis TaxID=1936063 RepID=UPI000A30E91C|nr:SEC-C domain-containing protein [Oceanobacillus senegalensis]
MSKIRRNDPCPCGSGKKYKKCCGAPNKSGLNPQVVTQRLYQLHQLFISFVMSNYEKTIQEQIKLHDKSDFKENDEIVNVYHTGLTIWILLHATSLNQQQTLFDIFSRKIAPKLSGSLKQIFSTWANAVPSVYEIQPFDPEEEKFVTVKDLQTKETYNIPRQENDDYIEGSLVVGTLLPFVDHHNFLYSMIKLYRHEKAAVLDLYKKYAAEKGGMKQHFPDFLADALVLGMSGNELDNEMYEKVTQLFANHLVNKDIHDETILNGIKLWNKYCKEEKPSFQKIEPYAAALEYLVQKTFLNNTSLTQSQVAKEYETSPGTVSTNFRKLSNALESEIKQYQ